MSSLWPAWTISRARANASDGVALARSWSPPADAAANAGVGSVDGAMAETVTGPPPPSRHQPLMTSCETFDIHVSFAENLRSPVDARVGGGGEEGTDEGAEDLATEGTRLRRRHRDAADRDSGDRHPWGVSTRATLRDSADPAATDRSARQDHRCSVAGVHP